MSVERIFRWTCDYPPINIGLSSHPAAQGCGRTAEHGNYGLPPGWIAIDIGTMGTVHACEVCAEFSAVAARRSSRMTDANGPRSPRSSPRPDGNCH